MAKLHGIDLDTITSVEETEIKNLMPKQMTGVLGTYPQDLIASGKKLRISGYLTNPTQAEIEQIKNLRHSGMICFLDLSDVDIANDLFGYGKVQQITWFQEERAYGIKEYAIDFVNVPAIGLVYIQTADAYITSLDKLMRLRMLNPLEARCAVAFGDTDNRDIGFQFVAKNVKGSTQDLIIEIHEGDNGTGDVTPIPDADGDNIRGAAVGGVGTISKMLGCNRRYIFKHSFTSGEERTYTVDIQHTAIPRITYIDGGMSEAPYT